MQLKKNFVARNIMQTWVLVPMGAADERYEGLLSLNDVAYSMWQLLPDATDASDIARGITEEYDVDYDLALKDAATFIESLLELGIL